MKTLVVIVSYNFERWMETCLGSLRRSDVPVDVIVIDNNSSDNTVERLRREYPEVRLKANKDNWGFGKANNWGFNVALKENYDYVFLLNQDAWVDTNTIGKLIDAAEANPEYGIVSPVHLTASRKSLDSGFPVKDLPINKDEDIHEIPFVNAALWLIPCRVLRVVGGFSPVFYHYGEDADMGNRMLYHGYKIGYVKVFGCHDRENRELTKPVVRRARTVYLLIVLANIRHSLPYVLYKGFGGGMEQVCKALVRIDLQDAAFYLKYTFSLFSRCPMIFRIRKQTKTRGAHFIDIKY